MQQIKLACVLGLQIAEEMSTHRRRCLIFITLAAFSLFSMITVHRSKATIRKNKYVFSKKTEEITSISSRVCQINHEHLENLYKVRLEPLPTQDRTKLFKEVATGGQWAPTSCKPRDHVAIIIPYRDRQEHLDILLQNLHPFLQSQKCHYQIFVIEQALPEPYNLGYTRNVGFVEASAVFNFTCYIFQDVDKIPVNNSLLYRCEPDRVLHFSSAEDRYQCRSVLRMRHAG
ncbi:beta-N-acetyl-D-glucosaminide beta-1,4-N-acetylglucosaminyl-transferase-like [Lingula anatina]|uniref:Beta-N-acetyl-D-glucosaminide beta-1,4-N-acetylglucosaminyl-transferase-like n=1 Tax=Lingula anatina TaxID=7574 RepID=A0A1S3HCI4_LINAN|nr:beta-N-acetyl-D-glucosaminide beta-1,4-N-acetylglucosaminyl-transferase-like [Lingula anatina]|eukprot:XP_013383723.1 beta-N-acetyl-D-glucosaminide beta-1,4-N-acetylglucosaminyl-transferase-like [Lingula anatina]